MSLIENHWQFPEQNELMDQQLHNLQLAGLEFSPAFLRLCINRGLVTKEQILEATNIEPQLYHDPFLFHDMNKAVDRLLQAIELGELILIYGDYDADGITSTLILIEALEELGANFAYYLPNRLIDGYGPNLERYQNFIDEGVQLILTCDNGIAGFEAIKYAMENGVDVIVSDHHEVQAELPDAYAIIHPRHPLGQYPFGELSGAGVALKLAHALIGELPVNSIELAAIGTIADLVSLTDENRTIVKSGLKLMSETLRIGLEKMLTSESVDLSKINAETIGFVVGPRLNAIGRLGDPSPALELLKEIDDEAADELLKTINDKNQERQAIVAEIFIEVVDRIEKLPHLPNIIIEANKKWPAGVLGIVASKVAERYHRPTLIFEYQREKKQYRGSGRSIEGINLFDCLNNEKHLLKQFGGHSQAVGLSVSVSEWENFRHSIDQNLSKYQEIFDLPKNLHVDMKLSLGEATEEFIEECSLLAPFGMDNPKPLFAFENVQLEQKRIIGTQQQHVKFSILLDEKRAEGIGFSKAELFETLAVDDEFSLIGHLSINEWQGNRNVQIQVMDIKEKGIKLRDFRSTKFNPELLNNKNTLFLYQNPQLGTWLQERIHSSNQCVTYSMVDDSLLSDFSQVALIETPSELSLFNKIVQNEHVKLIDLGVYLTESKWLAGLPNRKEFSTLYRWILSQKEGYEINKRLIPLSENLNLPIPKLKCMFKVFFEAKFVIMKNGLTVSVPLDDKVKVDLFQTDAYLQYEKSYQTEALLNFQTVEQIKQYINELRN